MRIGEGTKVRRHSETGEPDALRQLHVFEQFRVNRRLAAGEEEHVEIAGGVENELTSAVGVQHRPMRRIELLDAENAIAVAGTGPPNVENPQVLVPWSTFGLKADADRSCIRGCELSE